jgi:hypothetical protein
MRATSKRHDVALVVVAPLRKAANFKDAKNSKLVLDDVMGSASIGYAADTCTAVTSKYSTPPANGEVRLHVLKNRNGRTPDDPLVLRWQPDCGRIQAVGDNATAAEGTGSRGPRNATEETMDDTR